MNDLISRQAAIDAIGEKPFAGTADEYDYEQGLQNQWERDVVAIKILPPAQPEPAIPLSWIKGQIEWLKSLDNAFSTLTAAQISAMVNKWKDEQNERSN